MQTDCSRSVSSTVSVTLTFIDSTTQTFTVVLATVCFPNKKKNKKLLEELVGEDDDEEWADDGNDMSLDEMTQTVNRTVSTIQREVRLLTLVPGY